MRRFEFIGGTSEKFWEITQAGTRVTVRFGRLGTNGQIQIKDFEAQRWDEAKDQVAEWRVVPQIDSDGVHLRQDYEQHTLEAFAESYKHTDLGALDVEWYEAPEFFSARTHYIRAHPDEFVIRNIK